MELREGKAGKFVHCRPCNVVERLDDNPGGRKGRHEERKLLKKYQPSSSFGTSLGDALKAALEDQNDKR